MDADGNSQILEIHGWLALVQGQRNTATGKPGCRWKFSDIGNSRLVSLGTRTTKYSDWLTWMRMEILRYWKFTVVKTAIS